MLRSISMTTGLLSMMAVAATGCSGAAGSAGSSATDTASAGAAGPRVHLALAANAETRIAVHVAPKSVCTVAEGDATQKIAADDVGSVFLNVTPRKEGTGTVTLECAGEDGATTRYPLELEGTHDRAAIDETKAKMAEIAQTKAGTLRPALEGDPLSYAQDDLLARGYGRRPDPEKEADRYAHWLRAVSEPSTIVPSRATVDSASYGPNESPFYNFNWSGAVAQNPHNAWPSSRYNAYFWYASGEWKVPQVFTESSVGNHSQASTWVGIGGVGAINLWQGGTAEWTQSVLWFQIAGYNEWTQFAPIQNNGQTISNFNVNNGDDIYVEAYVCNPANGAENPTDASDTVGMCVHSHNYTQNEDNLSTYKASYFWNFNTAEAVQERPNALGQQDDYAQFNGFNFLSTNACATDGVNWVGGCNPISPQAGGLIPGPSPFSPYIRAIGSASHPLGGACFADYNGNCNDNGYYVRVWWNAHN